MGYSLLEFGDSFILNSQTSIFNVQGISIIFPGKYCWCNFLNMDLYNFVTRTLTATECSWQPVEITYIGNSFYLCRKMPDSRHQWQLLDSTCLLKLPHILTELDHILPQFKFIHFRIFYPDSMTWYELNCLKTYHFYVMPYIYSN